MSHKVLITLRAVATSTEFVSNRSADPITEAVS